jgi:hypothetical protein
MVRSPSKPFCLEMLPLFATDELLGTALLGSERVSEWRQMAPLLEARGLPKVDDLMGGRYVPAVKAFFDHTYGLDRGGTPPLAPDGVEEFEKWKRSRRRLV